MSAPRDNGRGNPEVVVKNEPCQVDRRRVLVGSGVAIALPFLETFFLPKAVGRSRGIDAVKANGVHWLEVRSR